MTCGYVCPQCEGSGIMEGGDDCDYCNRPAVVVPPAGPPCASPADELLAKEGLIHSENLHIVFWLIKDSCWMMSWKAVGTFMVFPTIFMAIFICFKTRHRAVTLLPNLAMLCWISANSAWMFSEFFLLEISKTAIFFFAAGLIIISYYFYLILVKKKKLF